MAIKKILRFERGSDHIGMYAAGIRVVEELRESIKHPEPQADELLWWRLGTRYTEFDGENVATVYEAAERNLHKWYFAFENLSSIRQWLYRNEWLIELHNNGIVISEYICEEDTVIAGYTQCIFCQYEKRFSYSIMDYFSIVTR